MNEQSSTSVTELLSWLPVDAIIRDGKPAIEWLNVGDASFSEPFFHETIARIKREQNPQSVITGFDSLLQLEKTADYVAPSAFIFHSSRCGSTLLANACRTLDHSLVISEAQVLDKIASRLFTDAEPGSPKEMLYLLFLRAAVSALGQRRRQDEQHYFVKFACTTTLQMARIRSIWPNVPFVFLYRDPVEIIVSNLKRMPEWMQPDSNPATAAAIVGVDMDDLSSLSAEEFCARALRRFFDAALTNKTSTVLVNYSELTFTKIIEVLNYCEMTLTPAEVDAVEKVSRLYSKDVNGRQAFSADAVSKRASASDLVIEMADKWARSSYENLEKSE
ncbi:MAG TPA: hypothetical protein VI306_13240 [Pyrinomonadaceae bacterium]